MNALVKSIPAVNRLALTGSVIFQQDQSDGPVKVSGRIQGLDPSALRGFHVHEFGNLPGNCTSAGAHYNPFNTTHGAPTDDINHRHIGDLGNIKSDDKGVANLDFSDHIIKLEGPMSIIGRSVVVHTGTDDLGRGGTPLSLTTGNSGDRAACGVISMGFTSYLSHTLIDD
ncbi:superoxide dismutase [Desarmillaria tabescens]|uniref:Superoxide dismutase [Cu-Zn] n=1 Tax=Armillaria tabescens TaxID=1929756 RepID=A0AA39K4H4_ARMTA|nr:superoxide dismutase [Desarmillaria tabescens]KAK0454197.1 superoxide dismutase [Desarmillaria tabescens]